MNNRGMDNKVLVRDARKARRAAAGSRAGPFPFAAAMAFFWRG